jgi:two-component system cell cycle response regulator
MSTRVLVVDDIVANVKLLGARLGAEYFEVLSATSGEQALDICARERVDVVLLDVMMPGMDGFEVCRRLKAAPRTRDLPVIMVTALDEPSDRVQGLEAGADDFLTKPVDDVALVTRVRNLARLKQLADAMAARVATARRSTSDRSTAEDATVAPVPVEADGGHVLVVDEHPRMAARLIEALPPAYTGHVENTGLGALEHLARMPCDVALISLALTGDGLRLCTQLRAAEATRHLPIVVLVDPGDEARMMRALDMGINDYLVRPVDRTELVARVRTQVRRKRQSDVLRACTEEPPELSVKDQLTGLANRRFVVAHLGTLVAQAQIEMRSLSVLVVDIDGLSAVNAGHGYDAGDAVLRAVAQRLRRTTRGVDLAGRVGGEEFVVMLPDTEMRRAVEVAERLRATLATDDLALDDGRRVHVTASIGLATLERATDTAELLLGRAASALAAAKRAGRNRVVAEAA